MSSGSVAAIRATTAEYRRRGYSAQVFVSRRYAIQNPGRLSNSPWSWGRKVGSWIEPAACSKNPGGQPRSSRVAGSDAGRLGWRTTTTSNSASGVPTGISRCRTPSRPALLRVRCVGYGGGSRGSVRWGSDGEIRRSGASGPGRSSYHSTNPGGEDFAGRLRGSRSSSRDGRDATDGASPGAYDPLRRAADQPYRDPPGRDRGAGTGRSGPERITGSASDRTRPPAAPRRCRRRGPRGGRAAGDPWRSRRWPAASGSRRGDRWPSG